MAGPCPRREVLIRKVDLRPSVKKNRDPVSPGRIRRTARVAGADRKLASPRIPQHPQRGLREYLRMALRVRNNFSILVGGCEQVSVWRILSGQRAVAFVKLRRRELDELREPGLLTHLVDGPAH